MRVDLNCDMGEGFGIYDFGMDEQLLDYVSSANIACGFHAGDPSVIRSTVRLCLAKGKAIGAHPGLPDLAGFGRREMALTPDETCDIVLYQVGALKAIVEAEGGRLHHVKPHGALYNMAARERELARAIVDAVRLIDSELILYAPPGSFLVKEAQHVGMRVALETFADRAYRSDGSLIPRSAPHAVLDDPELVVAQALSIVIHGKLRAQDGSEIPLTGDTICIHGDGANALDLARALHAAFKREGVFIFPPGGGR